MGSLSVSESRQRLDLPGSPPELASPGGSSLSSRSSPSTEQAWVHRTIPSLPMSTYGKAPGAESARASKVVGEKDEVGQHGLELSDRASSRQQLPSLHSLFGPPATIRPLQSPSERDSQYPANLTQDRSRISPGIAPTGNSYFPPTNSPPLSQPRSTYEGRLEEGRRTINSLAHALSGPQSPPFEQQRSKSESRPESESGKWSFHQETSRQEYSLGSRNTSFRSLDGQSRAQLPGPRVLQTPESPPLSKAAPTKDGLGPKIWTGSHFLPRFVRAAEVPGEGMCYFYDDGSHCKTVIDGEAVNAHWGVTKAGKPRKRLAIACITCREKKIKCDPDYPRCVQCEKFGRICKFKNAPRGGHNTSPSTSPVELDDSIPQLGGVLRQNEMRELRHPATGPPSPASPRSLLPHSSPEAVHNSKRRRVSNETYISNCEPSASLAQGLSHSKSAFTGQRPSLDMPRIPDDVLRQAWRTDPYLSDPQSIGAVLSKFFGLIDNTIVMRFLPEDIFKSWVAASVHRKSPDDMMLLYSVLAIGVALSDGPRHIAFEYAQVAHYAQKLSPTVSLQLVQSRILLALYNIAVSRFWDANELISSANASSACLQLNHEMERSNDANLTSYPFGMTRTCYAEARRRTFWSLFMLERLGPLFPERATMIHAEDIYIRLPSDSESFEKQIDTRMPMFNPYEHSLSTSPEKPSDITSHLVEMVYIWSSCQATIHRLASRPNASDAEGLRIRSLTKRVHDWYTMLPSRLMFTGSNLESAAFSGKVGSFLTMHLLSHHALIQLNRYHMSVGKMSVEYRSSHFHECCQNAMSIIDIVGCLDRILRIRPTILNTPPPPISTVVMAALDVLSSSGPIGTINDMIENTRTAKTVVDSTGNVWEHSRASQVVLDHRLQMLYRIRDQGPRPGSTDEYRIGNFSSDATDQPRWQIFSPMEQIYPVDMDVVYCLSN